MFPLFYAGYLANRKIILLSNLKKVNDYIMLQAKAPYDPPSAPGIPKIVEVGGHFVHLEWDKPETDGGARIQGNNIFYYML